VSEEDVRRGLDWLVRRHAALRSVLAKSEEDGVWRQRVEPVGEDAVRWFTLVPGVVDEDRLMDELDVAGGKPLVVVGMCDRVVRFVIHHLVVDGVSWRSMLRDWVRVVSGESPSVEGFGELSWRQWVEEERKERARFNGG